LIKYSFFAVKYILPVEPFFFERKNDKKYDTGKTRLFALAPQIQKILFVFEADERFVPGSPIGGGPGKRLLLSQVSFPVQNRSTWQNV
jgi:hypothetical protein